MPSKKELKANLASGADDLRILPIEEVASRMGWSTRSGEGPPITRLSARRRGVRDHFREWLDKYEEGKVA
jgi:hypothetical protein